MNVKYFGFVVAAGQRLLTYFLQSRGPASLHSM